MRKSERRSGSGRVTPVCDFVEEYRVSGISRFHMPGHKGKSFLGCEPYDITEVAGADVLSEAAGILRESQKTAAAVFGVGRTYFSTQGSSLCIKAMLCAVWQEAKERQICAHRGKIIAARNVHRAFVDACALLDLDVVFVNGREMAGEFQDSLCCCGSIGEVLETCLQREKEKGESVFAVYVTSPDYLGGTVDIAAVSRICGRYGLPLLVDNAHGAYLGFLEPSRHPVHLGAAVSCDSAHKTLPVLTGGSYLQVSAAWEERLRPYLDRAMVLFGSTSPSYLILQSLDCCNRYLQEGYRQRLQAVVERVAQIRQRFRECGICCLEGEPLKLTVEVGRSNYTGQEIAEELRRFQIECEYADCHYVVLMVTPENEESDFLRLEQWARESVLNSEGAALVHGTPCFQGEENPDRKGAVSEPERRISIREAVLAPSEVIPVTEAEGRICAAQTVSCPPAVPIVISGEVIDQASITRFLGNGIRQVCVVKEGGI